MKRWFLKKGSSTVDGLVQETVELPTPGRGEVRVKVSAVSLNYREYLVLGNAGGMWRADKDLVPVADGAGWIDAVGDGVEGWKAGDRVVTVYLRDFLHWPPNDHMGQGLGSVAEDGVLSEYVILSAERVTRVPDAITLADASTFPCAALTAWTAVQHANPVLKGQKVLTLGTGGVSLFAIAFARALGGEIYATSSQSDKKARLAELGVVDTFDYSADPEWGATVFKATGGVAKIVNTAGFGSINQCLEALAYGGDIGQVGLMNFGDAINPGPFLAKGVTIRGVPVGSREEQVKMIDFIAKHGIKPIVWKTFAFDEAKAAFEAQVAPDLFGKVIITVAAE